MSEAMRFLGVFGPCGCLGPDPKQQDHSAAACPPNEAVCPSRLLWAYSLHTRG